MKKRQLNLNILNISVIHIGVKVLEVFNGEGITQLETISLLKSVNLINSDTQL